MREKINVSGFLNKIGNNNTTEKILKELFSNYINYVSRLRYGARKCIPLSNKVVVLVVSNTNVEKVSSYGNNNELSTLWYTSECQSDRIKGLYITINYDSDTNSTTTIRWKKYSYKQFILYVHGIDINDKRLKQIEAVPESFGTQALLSSVFHLNMKV